MTIQHDRIGGRRLLALAVMAAALSTHHAQASDSDPFAALSPLGSDELAESRGGMMINGIPMNFSIVIRSTVEGSRSQGLQTTLTANDQGRLGRADTVAFGGSAQATDNGVAMTLPSGTTIIHQVTRDNLRTLMANSADNKSLSQVTDINIDLPGFADVTQAWHARTQAGALGRDASISALHR